MIKLTISAGYAWYVWEDKGGLQPTIESLAIPSKLGAKLNAWTFKRVAGIHAPTFTGRKEYDAKGRAIAADLQRAVGDRFHVMFHHWVAWDPTRWQTLWREEDLLSGESEEYWMEEDLPEKIALNVVRIYPDFCGAYLWDAEGCGIGNDDPAFSDDLDQRFTIWSKRWDACYDLQTMILDETKLAAEGFDDQGIALACDLKRAIGQAAMVIYYCTLSKSTLEVLEDGRTIEWPRETDFRQWALDQTQKK